MNGIPKLIYEPEFGEWPHVGYYKMRLVRGGPWVAASIGPSCPMIPSDHERFDVEEWCMPLDRSRHLIGWVDSKGFQDPWDFHLWCHRIDRAEFLYMVAHAAWVRDYAPETPPAKPREPIDLFTSKPVF